MMINIPCIYANLFCYCENKEILKKRKWFQKIFAYTCPIAYNMSLKMECQVMIPKPKISPSPQLTIQNKKGI